MKPRILLVENNIVSRFELRRVLSALGYEVDSVSNGVLAADAVQLTRYEMVFVNPNIPLQRGDSAIRLLRSLKSRSELPIITLAQANTLQQSFEYALSGANDVLCTPVQEKDVQKIVEKWSSQAPRDIDNGRRQA